MTFRSTAAATPIALVLAGSLGLGAAGLVAVGPASAAAGDASVEDGFPIAGYWRPPGDAIGFESFLNLGVGYLDPDGYAARLAENERLVDDWRAFGLFSFYDLRESGSRWLARGDGNSDDQGSGRVELQHSRPARVLYAVRYTRHLQFGDPETHDPYLPSDAPVGLAGDPRLRWDRLDLAYERRFGGGFSLAAGFDQQWRDGLRPALSASPTGSGFAFGAPSAHRYDTHSGRGWLRAAWAPGRFVLASLLSFRSDGGDRSAEYTLAGDAPITSIRYGDDRETWQWRVDATYTGGAALFGFGSYGYRQRRNRPEEVRTAATTRLDSREIEVDARDHTGQLGVVWRPQADLRLRALARYESLSQVGVSRYGGDQPALVERSGSLDRDRTRQIYSLTADVIAAKRTRIQLDFRFTATDRDLSLQAVEALQGGNLLVRSRVSERTSDVAAGKLVLRQRLSRVVSLTLEGRARSETVRQNDAPGSDLYSLGDHTRWTTDGRLDVRVRPARQIWLDAGGRLLREDFERDDFEDVRTRWDSARGFATLVVVPAQRVSCFLDFAIGEEEYRIHGELPAAAFDPAVYNPVAYRTTTYRFSPGVSVQPAAGLNLEGWYERVRNRTSVANDTDRFLVRATVRASERLSLIGDWHRYEFATLRGDDYDANQYSLSGTWHF
jgi:hypothetical protein